TSGSWRSTSTTGAFAAGRATGPSSSWRRSPGRSLVSRPAAPVDDDRFAGDVAGVVGGEEGDHLPDLRRRADAAERGRLQHPVENLLVAPESLREARFDQPRRDRVAADSARPQLDRQLLG